MTSSSAIDWRGWFRTVLRLLCVLVMSCVPLPAFVLVVNSLFAAPLEAPTWLFAAAWCCYAGLCVQWVRGRPLCGRLLAGGWLSLASFLALAVVPPAAIPVKDQLWGALFFLFFGAGPLLMSLYFTVRWLMARGRRPAD